jgi:hypothetical protein
MSDWMEVLIPYSQPEQCSFGQFRSNLVGIVCITCTRIEYIGTRALRQCTLALLWLGGILDDQKVGTNTAEREYFAPTVHTAPNSQKCASSSNTETRIHPTRPYLRHHTQLNQLPHHEHQIPFCQPQIMKPTTKRTVVLGSNLDASDPTSKKQKQIVLEHLGLYRHCQRQSTL